MYLPIAPEDLKTDFQLYTNLIPNDTDTLSYLDEESVRSSRYDKRYPLKILIHGFQNTGKDKWIIQIANKITENVIENLSQFFFFYFKNFQFKGTEKK